MRNENKIDRFKSTCKGKQWMGTCNLNNLFDSKARKMPYIFQANFHYPHRCLKTKRTYCSFSTLEAALQFQHLYLYKTIIANQFLIFPLLHVVCFNALSYSPQILKSPPLLPHRYIHLLFHFPCLWKELWIGAGSTQGHSQECSLQSSWLSVCPPANASSYPHISQVTNAHQWQWDHAGRWPSYSSNMGQKKQRVPEQSAGRWKHNLYFQWETAAGTTLDGCMGPAEEGRGSLQGK